MNNILTLCAIALAIYAVNKPSDVDSRIDVAQATANRAVYQIRSVESRVDSVSSTADDGLAKATEAQDDISSLKNQVYDLENKLRNIRG